MGTTFANPPLSNIQAELLKLFALNLPEQELVELKRVMSKFMLERARDKADEIWDQKGYNDKELCKLLDKDK